jgi:hypothetical protein
LKGRTFRRMIAVMKPSERYVPEKAALAARIGGRVWRG